MSARRSELGFSQVYVAELVGISRRTLQQIESGQANPGLNTLLTLLHTLGLQLTISKRITDEKTASGGT
ncbi:XRE family transcriptional regulator [Hymenobacter aquaticus]|uniref:XRE family transcriptional regulator n=2 Tax=Hymenobacter aquaticus TaxID=1867101 RepID=A0A4Z0PU31_9BACT|nr:XRE family transcriptional regulator [Hymenobacter aquaticus]